MSAWLWHGKAITTVSIRPHSKGHDEALALPTRSFDFVCAKAWQTLAMVSPSVHLVRNTKTLPTRRSSNAASCLRTIRCYGLPWYCNIWPTYDSLYGLATRSMHPRLTQRTVKTGISIYQPRPTPVSHNDRPAAFYDTTDLSFPLRSSSCIQRLNRQLPASNTYLHDSTYACYPHRTSSCTHLRLDHTSYRHHPSSWRLNTTASDFTHTFVNLTINCHFCYICYLAFVSFIVFGCHTHLT